MQLFGYEFKSEALAIEAITTPSYRMVDPKVKDNQRLEFLGDAVLELIVSEALFQAQPNAKEGELTIVRASKVSAAALCNVAVEAGLKEILKLSPSSASLPDNSKIFADAVEAIIGAIYLDGGMDAAREVVEELVVGGSCSCRVVGVGNFKGELQIKAQAMRPPRHPVYTLIKMEGKAHDPRFTVKVEVDGLGEATATACTRKAAESAAAHMLLEGEC